MKAQRPSKKPYATEILVLYIDDDVDSLKLAKLFLEKEDVRIKIDTTTSCSDALVKLETDNYESIVCDYQMPGMDGLEFLEVLRNQNNSIPFIILTGKSREEVAIKALNLGADRYLQKGGDPKTQYGILAQAIIQEVNHKRAEKSLLESEEKYRNLVERANDGIAIIQDSIIRYANQSLAKITSYSVEELIETKYLQYLHYKEHEKIRLNIEEMYKSNKRTILETVIIDKDGTLIDVEANMSLIPYQNEPAILIFVRDISEQKKAKKEQKIAEIALEEAKSKYQILIEKLEEGLTFEDPEGIITFVNPKTKKLLGYTKEELIGKHWSFIVPEKDRAKAQIETNKRPKGISSTYESGLLAKDGTNIPVIVSASPIFSDNKDYQGVIVLSTDITELKKTEKALKQSQDRENLLLTLLRHDLKNKIFIIHGYLSLLQASENIQKNKELITRALITAKESQQLLQKIGKLRDIEQEEELKPVYLKNILIATIDKNRVIAEDKNIKIDYKIDSVNVLGGALLEELFANIIENSIKHADCKKIEISTHEEQETVIITFEDDGKGLPNNFKDENYYRDLIQNNAPGAGIGLLLIARIAERYNGRIEIKDSSIGGLRIDIVLKKA